MHAVTKQMFFTMNGLYFAAPLSADKRYQVCVPHTVRGPLDAADSRSHGGGRGGHNMDCMHGEVLHNPFTNPHFCHGFLLAAY